MRDQNQVKLATAILICQLTDGFKNWVTPYKFHNIDITKRMTMERFFKHCRTKPGAHHVNFYDPDNKNFVFRHNL